MSENNTEITGEERLAELQEAGIQPENNQLIASRGWPPGMTCGLHPMDYFPIYENGNTALSELAAQLPEAKPIPENRAHFGLAANGEAVDPDHKFDLNLTPGELNA